MSEAPSPFIPGTAVQFAWDSTSLGLLKECPRKYYLSLVEGWRSKATGMHLSFGLHFHKALERFDILRSSGEDFESAELSCVHELLKDTFGWETGDSKKNRETLLRSVIWYLETYKDDEAKTIQLANGKPAVELSFRFETDYSHAGVPFLLSGHMDRLVEFGGNVYVMDRKTTGGALGSYYFDQYNPDNQMTLYSLAGRVVYDVPVAGVIIDAAQILVGSTAFARGITLRSEDQLDEWMEDFFFWMDTAVSYARRGHWPMNEKSCNNYGKCVFHDICNKDRAVRQQFLSTYFSKESPWNPLQTR